MCARPGNAGADGIVFSGAGPEETQYGYSWIDGHLPAQADEPTSLMDAEQIGRCAQAAIAGGVEYLGAKVCVPKDAPSISASRC